MIEKKITKLLIYNLSEKATMFFNKNKKKGLKFAIIALNLAKKFFYDDDDLIADLNSNLGALNYFCGNFSEANYYFSEALFRYKRSKSEGALYSYSETLKSLGDVNSALGEYKIAERQLRDALSIMQSLDHNSLAECSNNLGLLYLVMGLFDDAEYYFHLAEERWKSNINSNYAAILNNLGLISTYKNELDKAELIFKKALRIEQLLYGLESEQVAGTLINLGGIFFNKKDFDQAENLFLKALKIDEKNLPENHPNLTSIYDKLYCLYKAKKDIYKAELFLNKELEIIKKDIGENHFTYALRSLDKAEILINKEYDKEALECLKKANKTFDFYVRDVIPFVPERQKINFIKHLKPAYDILISIAIMKKNNRQFSSFIKDIIIRRKAVVLDLLCEQHAEISENENFESREILNTLYNIKNKIAALYSRKLFKNENNNNHNITDLITIKENLERQLGEKAKYTNKFILKKEYDIKNIQNKIEENTILIDYLKIKNSDDGNDYYIALKISNNDTSLYHIGEAKKVNMLVNDFISSIINTHYYENGTNRDQNIIGFELRKILIDFVEIDLNKFAKIFICPDGELLRLPFQVLPIENGQRIIDCCKINYLNCSRDLLILENIDFDKINQAIVVADPNFNLTCENEITNNNEKTDNFNIKKSLSELKGQKIFFNELPGTRNEGKEVAKLIQGKLLIQNEANKGNLQKIKSPYILHIATHGFFLKNLAIKRDFSNENFGNYKICFSNPMIRSGLALSGVNTWLLGKKTEDEAENGILTAEEVTGLDLKNTQLVVLSACETGLGDIEIGEGVFGLRRAFQIAGSKKLIMSLWKIPDEETKCIMIDFYKNYLDSSDMSESLRSAQIKLKKR